MPGRRRNLLRIINIIVRIKNILLDDTNIFNYNIIIFIEISIIVDRK